MCHLGTKGTHPHSKVLLVRVNMSMACNELQQKYTVRKYICLSSTIPCMKYSGAMFPLITPTVLLDCNEASTWKNSFKHLPIPTLPHNILCQTVANRQWTQHGVLPTFWPLQKLTRQIGEAWLKFTEKIAACRTDLDWSHWLQGQFPYKKMFAKITFHLWLLSAGSLQHLLLDQFQMLHHCQVLLVQVQRWPCLSCRMMKENITIAFAQMISIALVCPASVVAQIHRPLFHLHL